MPGCFASLPALPRPSVTRLLRGIVVGLFLATGAAVLAQDAAAPRLTADGEKEWGRKNNLAFTKALKATQPSAQEKDLLISGAKFYVDRLTNPDNAGNTLRLVDQFLNQIYGPSTSSAARTILLDATVEHCRELLTASPPFPEVVNTNLVILLSRLYSQAGNIQKGTPPVPFVATMVPLQAVLNSETLTLPPKIRAARALGVIGLNAQAGVVGGDLAIKNRDAIVVALVKALKSKAAQGDSVGACWYREALVDAIGSCDLPMTLAGGSDPIDALMGRLVDRKEELRVRGAAARAISQCTLNNTFNIPLIVHEIGIFHLQLAEAYNATPAAARTGAFKWAAWFGYSSFKPQDPAQAAKGWGLIAWGTKGQLAANKGTIDAAFTVCLPIVKELINVPNLPASVTAGSIDGLKNWLKKNAPTNRKVTPKSGDIPTPDSRAAYDPPGAAAPANGPMAPGDKTASPPMTMTSSGGK